MKRDISNSNIKKTVTREFLKDLAGSNEPDNLKAYLSEKELNDISSMNETILSKQEKDELKQRIARSVESQKSKRLYIKWGAAAAAVAVLLLSSFIVFQSISTSGIVEYASRFENSSPDGNTRLFLGVNEEVAINSEDSEIQHLKNSSEIKIDSEERVEQKLELKQVVYNTLVVPFGKRTKIVLDDNSTIWLNSGSKFIYPAKFSKEKREVFLEGEAVFEVAENKEKPFIVITKDVQVKVLGTVFNVSAYDNDSFTSTALESGLVEINYKKSLFHSKTLNITPGTVAVFNRVDESMNEHHEDVRKYTSWRYGILMLEAEPLLNIVNKLSRFHNVEIEIEDEELAMETFSGQLEYKQSAEQTLKSIGEIVDFELTADAGKITIFKN